MAESGSPQREDSSAWIRGLGLLSVIVADLLGFTGAGVGLGYLAWKKVDFPWWTLLITSFAGLALAMYRLYSLSQREGKVRK